MQKFMVLMTMLACLFLSLIGGALVAHFQLVPGLLTPQSKEEAPEQGIAPAALASLGVNHPLLASSVPEITPDSSAGVLRYGPARAWNGYTLISPLLPDAPVRLIDMEGETLHQWRIPDALLRPEGPALGAGQDAKVFQPSVHAQLAGNGDLIVAVSAAGGAVNGGGIARINKAADLLWHYPGPVRDDFTVTDDGGVYAVLRSERKEPWPELERIATPFLDDVLVQLDSGGKEIRRVSILEAIQNSPFIYLLQYTDPDRHAGDLLGVSSVSVLDTDQAALLPNAADGDILLSLRQLDVIAVMDPDVPVIKWAVRGSWHLQTDADVLDNGNILLFDSHGDLAAGGTSRVLEFEPVTLGIEWEFPGSSGEQLSSRFRGSQQRLPNGNTLVSDASRGRVLEVTADGDVVWEYRIPQDGSTVTNTRPRHAAIAQRFSPDQLEVLFESAGLPQ